MESHPLVYIRTDGNDTIATGHLMRCLTIAQALRHRGAVPSFILSDGASVSLLQQLLSAAGMEPNGFSILQLQTDYRNLDQEIPLMQGILSSHNVSCLLVDSYFATPKYLSAMQQLCRTAYLDDLQAFDCPADIVINYDLVVDNTFYHKAGKLLTGCAYTPLREQFSRYACHPWDTVKDIFISTGGTDPYGIAPGIASRLLADPVFAQASLHILTGPMHVQYQRLLELSQADGRILLHRQVTEMAALMADCDLGFSAGGTTLYELCCVGVPSVSYSMADNQLPGVQAFDRAGLIPWIGDIRSHPNFYELALERLRSLAKSPDLRREQSLQMRMAIDGAGAQRIAEALT